ncbi:MAG: hypothetical protein J6D15_00505 [Clostridia bacterium]|nr:hypothetical protein [Clostridia bacterium]
MDTNLGKRYMSLKNTMDNMNRYNKACKKIYDLETEFSSAIKCLKKYECTSYRLIDNNVCALSTSTKIWMPLTKESFIDNLTDAEKKEAYRIIRLYLRKKQSLSTSAFPCTSVIADPLAYNYSARKPSDKTIQFLYDLTLGKKEEFCNFAKLCSVIKNPSANVKKSYVILADQVLHQPLLHFFAMLVNNNITTMDFNFFTKVVGIQELHIQNLNGCKANVIIEGAIPERELTVNKISNILSGKKISTNHPSFSGKLFVVNRIPFIYITASHKKYIQMKNLYGSTCIKLSSKKELTTKFTADMSSWFNNELVKLGEELQIGKMPHPTQKIRDDDIFKAFTEDLCILSENAVCPKAKLYEIYSRYYQKFYGTVPLSQITFSKRFAIYGNFETIRPHTNSKSYPYCFKGVTIDDKRVETLLNPADTQNYYSTFKDFKYFLDLLYDEKIKPKTNPIKAIITSTD